MPPNTPQPLAPGSRFGLWRVIQLVADPRPGAYYLCECLGPWHPEPVQAVVRGTALRSDRTHGCRKCQSHAGGLARGWQKTEEKALSD
jgi:hypothetical protein